MHVEVMSGTTTAGGAATVYSQPLTGKVAAVFVDGTNLSDGADMTLAQAHVDVDAAELVGENIINHGDVGNAGLNSFYPRRIAGNPDGSDLEVATGQDVPVQFVVAATRLKAVIANGGSQVAFRIWVVLE